MQAYILLGPSASLDGGGGTSAATTNPKARHILSFRNHHPPLLWSSSCPHHHRSSRCSAIGRNQNHYAVLGVSADASISDIKKAYRLLALKYHPDVSKDARADETFKNIRLAYDILSNETARNQYDRDLKYHHSNGSRPVESSWSYSPGLEEQLRIYRWAYLQRKMQREKFWQQNPVREKRHPFYDEDREEASDDYSDDQERGSFTEVLQSTLLTLFLMHTVGIRLSLTFSSIMAFLDQKLDGGYKMGYFIAWMLGGSGGIMLTLCLSFASWVCGKTSSGIVALVVVSMWFVSNLARFVPLPQGALLALLYMSIKLQVDFK